MIRTSGHVAKTTESTGLVPFFDLGNIKFFLAYYAAIIVIEKDLL
jgi:hypothetical protein